MDDTEIRTRLVEKLLRKRVVGAHKKRVDTVVNWLPSHDQGRGETVLREMIADPDAPVEAYGGSRDNVRLTSVPAAVAYLREHGGNVPFGFE
ncbi:MAG: hypothetical protein V5A23_05325 [Halobacteriales archaeon]